ncbi:MAG TPA: ASKHA domain-containing protein [Victivallales bacterium]|nr:ASKHA domain-containing protein [Victivallales bacterium]HRR29018.1 ASKHA domain-containing protein [Victivallales bacterium]
MKNYRIYFPHYKKEIYALEDSSLLECIMRAGILIKNPCAGQGICGKCKIRVISGESTPDEQCKKFFSQEELENGWRLACRLKIKDNLEIDVPSETIFENELLILTQDDKPFLLENSPLVRKKFFSLIPPSLENQKADFEALREDLSVQDISLETLRTIPMFLRENSFKGTAVLSDNKIICLDKGNTESINFAVAVDIGTTTIVVSLIDIVKGKTIDSKGSLNPQTKFGDDLISRIMAEKKSAENLEQLQSLVIQAVNNLIRQLCQDNGIKQKNIYSAAVAGNTVMECFFCGITAKNLGEIPFVPPFKKPLLFEANDLGIDINPEAPVYIFPLIGGFVGGDITAGISACRLDEREKPTLFIDIGTNGEIVLANGGNLFAASAAAGPAFEGARIEYGMRASKGAIEKVIINREGVHLNVIGNTAPLGICGSAVIDSTAELLKIGILESSGRILSPDELSSLPKILKDRLISRDDGQTWDFLLQADNKKKIFISQRDIREIQLATGAIRATINILLQKIGITPEELDTVLVAGGFGNFIRRNNAVRIGLLPNIPDYKIRYVGNTSSEGAKEALLSGERRRKAEELAEKTNYIEISLDPEFQMIFSEAMIFP